MDTLMNNSIAHGKNDEPWNFSMDFAFEEWFTSDNNLVFVIQNDATLLKCRVYYDSSDVILPQSQN